jgi:hypothetical protein
MTRLNVGDAVWVGPEANPIPGHILSIHRLNGDRDEYVIRTLDLGGRPGENLNLHVRTSNPDVVVRPRRPTPIARDAVSAVTVELGHAAG